MRLFAESAVGSASVVEDRLRLPSGACLCPTSVRVGLPESEPADAGRQPRLECGSVASNRASSQPGQLSPAQPSTQTASAGTPLERGRVSESRDRSTLCAALRTLHTPALELARAHTHVNLVHPSHPPSPSSLFCFSLRQKLRI